MSFRPSGLLVMVLALLWPGEGADAGLKISSQIEVKTATSCDSLSAITYLSGPWMRREVWGKGALSQMFGKTVQIVNRLTGASFTLYPDERCFSRDSLGPQVCAPEAVVDLRFLGSVQSRATVTVSLPDTMLELLGAAARPVQVDVRPRHPARQGTRIRIWAAADLERLFGPDYATDLLCGGGVSGAAGGTMLSEAWRTQFRLTDEDAARMAKGLVGYPVKIVSLYGPDSAPVSSTTIQATRIEQGALSDSLFAPPPGYREDAAAPSGRPTE